MAHNQDERSFFEWAVPDVTPQWLLWTFGLIGLIILLLIMLAALAPARHLSVDGGRDQIAAGVPAVDDPRSVDQIAAGVPALDDPQTWPAPQPGSGSPKDDVEPTDDAGEDDEASAEDISDEGTADQVVDVEDIELVIPPFGTWDLRVEESGEATCGYPDEPLTFDATIVISEGMFGAEDTDDPSDDEDHEPYEIRFERPFQILVGSFSAFPAEATVSGQGWAETTTITEFDPDGRVFRATSVYETDDCRAERLLVGVGF